MDLMPYGEAIAKGSELLTNIIKRVFPEKMSEEVAGKLNQEMTMALVNGEANALLAQLAINAEEAKSDSVFVAGWRPAVGWTCAAAFAYFFVLQPFLTFVLLASGVNLPPLPVLDMGPLMMVLGTILGVGGLRTYEKVKGVANAPVGK